MIRTEAPELSIIIVNYFSEAALKRCLPSIDCDPSGVEVIVADNGSTQAGRDELMELFPNISWLAMEGNTGFAHACNRGASAAKCDKLLFLNPDTWVFPGALAELIRQLDRSELAGAIAGLAIFDESGDVQLSCRRFPTWTASISNRYSIITKILPRNFLSGAYLMTDFDHRRAARVDWVSGAAMAMNRKTFSRLNGFDTYYFLYCEDVDLCRRARDAGIETWYCPEVKVVHTIGGSSRQNLVRALRYRHQSVWRYYKRFHRNAFLDIPVFLFLAWRFAFSSMGAVLQQKRKAKQLASDFKEPQFAAPAAPDADRGPAGD